MSSSQRGERLDEEAAFPASAPAERRPDGQIPSSGPLSLVFLLTGRKRLWGEGTELSLAFICHRSTSKLSQDQINFPINLHFPLPVPPPECLPGGRSAILVGPCVLSEVLDLTSNYSAIVFAAFDFPVPAPMRSRVNRARLQCLFWHMVAPESLCQGVRVAGVGVGSIVQHTQRAFNQ